MFVKFYLNQEAFAVASCCASDVVLRQSNIYEAPILYFSGDKCRMNSKFEI